MRIVLLKHLDRDGLVFYTNTRSRKGQQLAQRPWAATAMHWKHLDLQVQVRSEGRIEPVSDAEADAYFQSRARGSQLGAWASLQSEPLDEPGQLLQRLEDAQARFAEGPVPRPPHWSGYRLRPERFEFWHGRPHRLHERIVPWQDGAWRQSRLYPDSACRAHWRGARTHGNPAPLRSVPARPVDRTGSPAGSACPGCRRSARPGKMALARPGTCPGTGGRGWRTCRQLPLPHPAPAGTGLLCRANLPALAATRFQTS